MPNLCIFEVEFEKTSVNFDISTNEIMSMDTITEKKQSQICDQK